MNRVLKTIWNELVHGGHLTSLGASGIGYGCSLIFNKPVNIYFLLLLYLATQSIYIFDRLNDVENDKSSNAARSEHLNKRISHLSAYISIYLGIFLVVMLLKASIIFIATVIPLIILGLLYGKIIKPLSSKIIGLKSYMVMIFWSIIPLLFMLFNNYRLTISLAFIVTFLILRESVNCWFCDIKDIETDKSNHVLTLSNKLGKKRTVNVLIVLNIISALPILLGVWLHWLPLVSLFLLFSILYAFVYLVPVRFYNSKNEFILGIAPDIEPLLYSIFMLLGGLFV